jgi:hypothetical protein
MSAANDERIGVQGRMLGSAPGVSAAVLSGRVSGGGGPGAQMVATLGFQIILACPGDRFAAD